MEIIKDYLENIFSNIPKTPETLKAKEELLTMMEDKYNELKLEGKSENEAIGTVISEFGNIDELLENLDFSPKEKAEESNFSYSYDKQEIKTISLNRAKEIIKEHANISKKIALGVFLCICSPILLISLSGFAETNSFSLKISSIIGLVALFIMVAYAIVLFITYGAKMEKIELLKREPFVLDYLTKEFIKKEEETFKAILPKKIAFGVALCILSVVPIIITGLSIDNVFVQCLSVSLLLLMVAFAVEIFIVSAMKDSTYKILLEKESNSSPYETYGNLNGNYYKGHNNHYKSPLTQTISSIYWPIVTIIYLLWSFSYGNWATSWIIWPIAGILFRVICSLCKSFETKKKI